jgi:hypothetical protein
VEQLDAPIPEAATVAPPPAPGELPAAPATTAFTAGVHNGRFYLRDPKGNFVFVPRAVVAADAVTWIGEGTDSPRNPGMAPQVFLRVARLGFTAEVWQRFSLGLVYEADRQPLVNPRGTNQTQAAPPGTDPGVDTARYAPAQSVGNQARILDAWVNARVTPELNIMMGQFLAPFTLSNTTAFNALPFRERPMFARLYSLRDVGINLWGDLANYGVSYAVGVFGGDDVNRPGVDARADYMARFTWKPLQKLTQGTWGASRIGVSGRVGTRDPKRVLYDVATPSTGLGFRPFQNITAYTDASGNRVRTVPADDQLALAAELVVPIERVTLELEGSIARAETRAAVEGQQETSTLARGVMNAGGASVTVGVSLLGDPRLRGESGTGTRPTKLDFSKPHSDRVPQELELLGRVEVATVDLSSTERDVTFDGGDAFTVYGAGLALNYWAAKALRLTAEWITYVPDAHGDAAGPDLVSPVTVDRGEDAQVFSEAGARMSVFF